MFSGFMVLILTHSCRQSREIGNVQGFIDQIKVTVLTSVTVLTEVTEE